MDPEISAFLETRLSAEDQDALEALTARLGRPTLILGPALHTMMAGAGAVDLDPTSPSDADNSQAPDIAGRYQDLGIIGTGAMGEVRRVRDRELNRTLAMKTLHPTLLRRPKLMARFVEEAQATSQLQHANIVPIHDIGTHADGRVWFTMREVLGRPLTDVISEVHAARTSGSTPTGAWTFRRLVAAFLQVCEAVGYAHQRGVVHRDLKPENVMVGDHGEVFVVDWGLAKLLGRPDWAADAGELDPVVTDRARSDANMTRIGTVAGTPAYMSPEQARGEVDRIDARSDVYGLGAMLFEVLCGRRPFQGGAMTVLGNVAAGRADPLPADPALPGELAAACQRAMALLPDDRFASAAALASAIRSWLEGVRRREQALEVTTAALAHGPEAASLHTQADALDASAHRLLEQVEPWDPETQKAPGWALLDQAADLRAEADLQQVSLDQGLHGALRIDPSLPEAHASLAERYLSRHEAAEGKRDPVETARSEARLLHHVAALPEAHPVRQRSAAYLKGDGAVSLWTDPPGAQVELHRNVVRNRRLVTEPVRTLGRTPLIEVPLEMGSYVCVIRHPGRADVRYPVHLGRGAHWHGVPPGERDARPIHLPRLDALAVDDCYIPSGWFLAGGDDEATHSLPATRLWCDGFIMKRFSVTQQAYLDFMNQLISDGREADAVRWAPHERSGTHGEQGALCYGRDPSGRFMLVPDADGDTWQPNWPVFNVDFEGAVAYARWLAAQTGDPWRLPGDFEWEKAARGVDGRWFPWGDRHDPAWACMRDSHPGRPLPPLVTDFPVDESVYGVRGLGGGVREWCADLWDPAGVIEGGLVPPVTLPDTIDPRSSARRAVRGGYWVSVPRSARCANRSGYEPGSRYTDFGFRPARSLPNQAGS